MAYSFSAKQKRTVKLSAVIAAAVIAASMLSCVIFIESAPGTYYHYSASREGFVRDNLHFVLDNDNDFTYYDATGMIAFTLGRKSYYVRNEDTISVYSASDGIYISDVLLIKQGRYLISYESIIEHAAINQEDGELEGYYTLDIGGTLKTVLLKDKKVYSSADESNSLNSFTKSEGTYTCSGSFLKMQTNGNIETDEGTQNYLVVEFYDDAGYSAIGLTQEYFKKAL